MHMTHFDLEISYEGDKGGWRMVRRNPSNSLERLKSPQVGKGDTIQWHAPKDKDVCIMILKDSTFERSGTPVKNEVIEIAAGGKSETLQIADSEFGPSEYGAMVRNNVRDYTYVRGEMSPPGVIVGPKP
jgi:hypothetical protein